MMFGVALEVLRKYYGCRTTTGCGSLGDLCDRCEYDVDADTVTEALKTVLDAFGNCSELPNSSGDLIDRAEAQMELQFAARRYTVSYEAYGECQVVWSENIISVTDAMNALRKVPSIQDKQNFTSLMSGTSEDLVSSSYLLAEYERQHEGSSDGARKIIAEAPSIQASTSQTKFKPGDKFLLEIGEKRIGLDEYSIVGTDLYVWGSLLEKLTPYEPTVQAEQKWIPCSERMPEEDHWLGGSGKQFSENVLVTIVNHDDEDIWVDTTHTIDGEWILELPRYCEITAWQQLPESYRGDTDE